MTATEHPTMFPLGADETPYRKIPSDHVSVVSLDGESVLKVDPEALSVLTAEAFRDINHFLRPAHLAQLRKILDDPEASDNDKFVAFDLLKNASNKKRLLRDGVLETFQGDQGGRPAGRDSWTHG